MPDLINVESVMTMTSKEMADLTEKRHDSVKRTIDTLAEKGTIQLPQIVEVTNRLGQTVTEYRIGKRDSYVIVAQLSPEFTARLVDRWQELETKVQKPSELSRMDILKLAMESEQARMVAEAKLIEQAPKVDFFDAVAVATNCQSFEEVAKVCKTGRNRLMRNLRETGVLRANNLPYQNFLDAGYFDVVERTYEVNGESRIGTTTRVTGKGLEFIQKRLSNNSSGTQHGNY